MPKPLKPIKPFIPPSVSGNEDTGAWTPEQTMKAMQAQIDAQTNAGIKLFGKQSDISIDATGRMLSTVEPYRQKEHGRSKEILGVELEAEGGVRRYEADSRRDTGMYESAQATERGLGQARLSAESGIEQARLGAQADMYRVNKEVGAEALKSSTARHLGQLEHAQRGVESLNTAYGNALANMQSGHLEFLKTLRGGG